MMRESEIHTFVVTVKSDAETPIDPTTLADLITDKNTQTQVAQVPPEAHHDSLVEVIRTHTPQPERRGAAYLIERAKNPTDIVDKIINEIYQLGKPVSIDFLSAQLNITTSELTEIVEKHRGILRLDNDKITCPLLFEEEQPEEQTVQSKVGIPGLKPGEEYVPNFDRLKRLQEQFGSDVSPSSPVVDTSLSVHQPLSHPQRAYQQSETTQDVGTEAPSQVDHFSSPLYVRVSELFHRREPQSLFQARPTQTVRLESAPLVGDD